MSIKVLLLQGNAIQEKKNNIISLRHKTQRTEKEKQEKTREKQTNSHTMRQ